MKGIRFYLEHESPRARRKGLHSGNVLAVCVDCRHPGTPLYDAVGAVYFTSNSPVASTCVNVLTMRPYLKRIPEAEARRIHPNLFAFLEAH